MNNKDKNNYVLKAALLLGIIGVFTIGALTFNVFKNGNYTEWITMLVSFFGAVVGGIFTMLGVIITLNKDEDKCEKGKLDQIKRIKVILNCEIESFILSFQEEFIRYASDKQNIIQACIRRSELNESDKCDILDIGSCEFNINRLYKLDDDFKKYMYDLIVLDEESNSKELINWYKSWSLLNNINNKEIQKNNLDFLEGLVNLLGIECLEMRKYILRCDKRIESKNGFFKVTDEIGLQAGKEIMRFLEDLKKDNKKLSEKEIGCSIITRKVLKYLEG